MPQIADVIAAVRPDVGAPLRARQRRRSACVDLDGRTARRAPGSTRTTGAG